MRSLLLLPLAALIAGCATATPPAQVTRFHRLDAATITAPTAFYIVAPDDQVGGLEWTNYASAVAAELERNGFTCALRSRAACVLSPTSALQPTPSHRVTVRFDRAAATSRSGGSGVGVGVGGSTGSYGSGVGVGVGVGVDLTRLLGGGGPDTALRLAVRIDQRDGTALWEGRAETLVRSRAPAAQPGLAAARLAAALFAGFPGRSGETITVP